MLATNFCQKHGLDDETRDILKQQLIDKISKVTIEKVPKTPKKKLEVVPEATLSQEKKREFELLKQKNDVWRKKMYN